MSNSRPRDLHPATAAVLINFRHSHLPPHLAEASRPFCEVAVDAAVTLPDGPEKTETLRKLLEAKDCAVRAVVNADEDAVAVSRAMIEELYRWDAATERWVLRPEDPRKFLAAVQEGMADGRTRTKVFQSSASPWDTWLDALPDDSTFTLELRELAGRCSHPVTDAQLRVWAVAAIQVWTEKTPRVCLRRTFMHDLVATMFEDDHFFKLGSDDIEAAVALTAHLADVADELDMDDWAADLRVESEFLGRRRP